MSLAELAQALNSIKQPLPQRQRRQPMTQPPAGRADPYRDAKKDSEAYGMLGDHMKQYDSEFAMPDGQEGPSVREGETNDPMSRWRAEIDAMRTSGNPTLIDDANSQISAYQQRMNPASAQESRTSDIKEYEYAINNDGFTGSFQDYKNQNKTKMFAEELVKQNDQFQDKNGKIVPIKSGTPMSKIYSMGLYPYKPKAAGDVGKMVMLDTAIKQFPEMDKAIYGEDGSYNRDVINASYALAHDPSPSEFLSKIITSGVYGDEVLSKAESLFTGMEMGLQAITRSETGAAMPPSEVDNTRKRFQPGPMENDATSKMKYEAYKYFLNTAADLMDPRVRKGGTPAEITREVNRLADEALAKGQKELNSKENKVELDPELKARPDDDLYHYKIIDGVEMRMRK